MRTTSNLVTPTIPSSLWDFVPFLCAGLLALLFTLLLVLLVEDAEDREIQSNANSFKAASTLTSEETLPSTRIVGHAEKQWGDGIQSTASELQMSAVPFVIPPDHPQRSQLLAGIQQLSKRSDIAALLKQYRPTTTPVSSVPPGTRPVSYHKGLLASPSANTVTHNAPILSMAKMIMHRHDQANRRAHMRRSKMSPPPSPPVVAAPSFSTMQQQQYSPPPMMLRFPVSSPPPSPTFKAPSFKTAKVSPPPSPTYTTSFPMPRSPTSPTTFTTCLSPPLSPPPYQRPRVLSHVRTPSLHISSQQQRYQRPVSAC